jgi:exosome complex RNA-binding protein Csl4
MIIGNWRGNGCSHISISKIEDSSADLVLNNLKFTDTIKAILLERPKPTELGIDESLLGSVTGAGGSGSIKTEFTAVSTAVRIDL